MFLVDTHCHIYLPDFDTDRDEVIDRAVASGVKHILMPNIDSGSVQPMLETENKYHEICLPMMGLHPTSVKSDYKRELGIIEKHLGEHQYIGIGETGIDLYWDKTWFTEQVICFRQHLKMAEELRLPVIIHARESIEVIFDELRRFGTGRVKGIFHAFPGGRAEARIAADLGFFIGIGGVITFRNSRLGEAALEAGPDNIVLETDSPYLAPVPFRGKRNESAYLSLVVDKLSDLFGIAKEEVADMTTMNACKLFNI